MRKTFLIYPVVSALLLMLGFFWRVQNSERMELLRGETLLLERAVSRHGRLIEGCFNRLDRLASDPLLGTAPLNLPASVDSLKAICRQSWPEQDPPKMLALEETLMNRLKAISGSRLQPADYYKGWKPDKFYAFLQAKDSLLARKWASMQIQSRQQSIILPTLDDVMDGFKNTTIDFARVLPWLWSEQGTVRVGETWRAEVSACLYSSYDRNLSLSVGNKFVPLINGVGNLTYLRRGTGVQVHDVVFTIKNPFNGDLRTYQKQFYLCQ